MHTLILVINTVFNKLNSLPILVLGEGVNEPLPLSLDTLKIKKDLKLLYKFINIY